MTTKAESTLTYPEALAIPGRQDMYLCLASTDDVEAIHALIEPNWDYLEEFQHLDETDPSLEAVAKALDETIQGMHDGKGMQYIVMTAGDTPVGRTCLELGQNVFRLGYWVGEEFQGHGYATSAARRLVRFGFEEMNLEKIIARIDDRNDKSQRVAKRLGAQATSRHETDKKGGHQITYRVWEIEKHD